MVLVSSSKDNLLLASFQLCNFVISQGNSINLVTKHPETTCKMEVDWATLELCQRRQIWNNCLYAMTELTVRLQPVALTTERQIKSSQSNEKEIKETFDVACSAGFLFTPNKNLGKECAHSELATVNYLADDIHLKGHKNLHLCCTAAI